jgi:hypothetical protein
MKPLSDIPTAEEIHNFYEGGSLDGDSRWAPASVALKLAEDLLSLADDAGMPDSYKATDSRVQRARLVVEQFKA